MYEIILTFLFGAFVVLPSGGFAIVSTLLLRRALTMAKSPLRVSLPLVIASSWVAFGLSLYSFFVDFSWGWYALAIFVVTGGCAQRFVIPYWPSDGPPPGTAEAEEIDNAVRDFLSKLNDNSRETSAPVPWRIKIVLQLVRAFAVVCVLLFFYVVFASIFKGMSSDVTDLYERLGPSSNLVDLLERSLEYWPYLVAYVGCLALGWASRFVAARVTIPDTRVVYRIGQSLYGVAFVSFWFAIVTLFVDGWPRAIGPEGYFAIFAFFFATSPWALALTRPSLLPSLDKLRALDPRPPILYLRSFVRESRRAARRSLWMRPLTKMRLAMNLAETAIGSKFDDRATSDAMRRTLEHRGIFGRLSIRNVAQSIVSGRGTMFDEQLVVANIMNRFGPYIGIARPGEVFLWGDVGSAKKRLPNDEWHELMQRLFAESAAIVIEAGSASQGLMWEIGQIVEMVSPQKVLLIASPNDHDYEQFHIAAQHVFPAGLPLPRPISRFVIFDDKWHPRILRELDIEDAITQTSCEVILQPFIEQCGLSAA